MRTFTCHNTSNWDDHLPYVEMYINATSNVAGMTPHKIVYGKDM